MTKISKQELADIRQQFTIYGALDGGVASEEISKVGLKLVKIIEEIQSGCDTTSDAREFVAHLQDMLGVE